MEWDVLIKLRNGQVEFYPVLDSDQNEELVSEIIEGFRRVVEEALDSVGAEELVASGEGLAGGRS